MAASVLLTAGPGVAQEGLRVVQDPERVEGNKFVISGRVLNESRRDALDVYVTVDALDGAHNVVASGIAHVSNFVPARGNAPFVAKVPRVPTAATFRVSITGYRFGLSSESP